MCKDEIKIGNCDLINTLVEHDGNSWSTSVKDKYLKHAEILEKEVLKHNNPRDIFYLAQSYRDASEPEKAIQWYKKRIEAKNGFTEEVYYSQFMIGVQLQALKKDFREIVFEYLKCSEYDSDRAEHLLNAIILLQNNNLWQTAYTLSKDAVERFHNKLPNKLLFIHKETYLNKLMLVHNINLNKLRLK